ncbi:MAG: hypothetical protein K8T91_05795 [Planctomycetes bacterium]|nr:hypothetical protein [Planctomycetota bacterium]
MSPQPPPIPDGLTPEEEETFLQLHGYAFNLKEKTGAAYLSATGGASLGDNVPAQAFDFYMQGLLKEAGQPTDPIERMLVEQIALAHHNIGRLYLLAAGAETLVQAATYNAAAVRLVAEFRRTALSLKKYREPPAAKHFTVVKQQNLAQNQQVALITAEEADQQRFSKQCDSELTSNKAIEHVPQQNIISQPQTRGSRETEPVEAQRANARRPATPARRGPVRPPVAVRDWSEDCEGEDEIGS